MTMTELFKAVGVRLNLKRPDQKKVSFGIGIAAKDKFKAPPNVIFAPTQGKGRPPQAKKSVRVDAAGALFVDNTEPETLWERDLQIAHRIYGEDIDDCDELAGQLLDAWHDETSGNYTYEGEEWDTTGLVANGMVLVVFVRIEARFNRTNPLLVRPETLVDPATLDEQVAP